MHHQCTEFCLGCVKVLLVSCTLGHKCAPNKSQCVCTWFGLFWSVLKRMQHYNARQPTTKMLCFFKKEAFQAPFPPPTKPETETANHNVVQSQPWSGPGCVLPGGKVETLEDMPGHENCIETPLSQQVQWAKKSVLRNPCIGCFGFLFLFFFV